MKNINAEIFIWSLWILYYIIHTLLSGNKVRNALANNKLIQPSAYRLIYSIIAIIGFLALILVTALVDSPRMLPEHVVFRYVSLALSTWGILIIRRSFSHISFKSFIDFKPADSNKLITSGIYAHIRHPMYAGGILLFLGLALYTFTPLHIGIAIISILYIIWGIKREEKILLNEHKKRYEQYRVNVPMLIPPIPWFQKK